MVEAVNRHTKRAMIYKLRAMSSGSANCVVCHRKLADDPNRKRHLCGEHADYAIVVYAEGHGYSVCEHCHCCAVQRGQCQLCLRYSPMRELAEQQHTSTCDSGPNHPGPCR